MAFITYEISPDRTKIEKRELNTRSRYFSERYANCKVLGLHQAARGFACPCGLITWHINAGNEYLVMELRK